MTNKTKLIAFGTLLAGAIAAALLVFATGPGSVGEPVDAHDAAPPSAVAPIAEDGGEPSTAASGAGPDQAIARREATPTATTGTLLVTVRWSGGEPAPGIAVSFRTATRGLPVVTLERAISDDEGRIRADGLPAGPLPND